MTGRKSRTCLHNWTSHNARFDQNIQLLFYKSRKHIIAKKNEMVDTIHSRLDRDLVTIKLSTENLSKHKFGNQQHTLSELRWRGSKDNGVFANVLPDNIFLLPIISGNVWCWQHICDRRHVVFYVASCITRTLRLTSAGRSCVSVVSSSDMVTARRTIRNRIFYPGPFLDYHCFHQSLWFQYL